MKKILLALDGEHFPEGAFELACLLHQQEPVLLTGTFLNPVDVSRIVAYTGLEAVPLMPALLEDDFSDQVQQNIQRFRGRCEREGMEFRLHNLSNNLPLTSLIKETRFADLLLISRESFFSNISKEQPNEYMQELLQKTECPVIVVPEGFEAPGQTVILYDGSASAVFALKQFAYLLPQFAQLPATLVEISSNPDERLPDQDAVAELAARHYPDLTLHELAMENKSNTSIWLQDHSNTWVVMGAYGRSLISTIFKKSFADEIINSVELPLFIAHK